MNLFPEAKLQPSLSVVMLSTTVPVLQGNFTELSFLCALCYAIRKTHAHGGSAFYRSYQCKWVQLLPVQQSTYIVPDDARLFVLVVGVLFSSYFAHHPSIAHRLPNFIHEGTGPAQEATISGQDQILHMQVQFSIMVQWSSVSLHFECAYWNREEVPPRGTVTMLPGIDKVS